MPVYVVIAALATVASVPILWYSLALDRAPSRRVSRNLSAGVLGTDLRGVVLARPPMERILQPVIEALGRPARRLSPKGMVTAVERRLELSGVAWPVERVLVVKFVAGGGLLAAGLAWTATSGSSVSLLVALFAGLVGYLGPDLLLGRLATARQLLISNQLPDLLDQLTICVEAGLGFDSALARTSKSAHGPLADEVTRLLQDLRIGVPRAEALDNLLTRTDVPELRQFVHAVIQAESYGAPVSRVLRSQADEQREKRRFRAEERAMKLPIKVIFPLVFCIMPTLFIVVIGPAYVHLSGGL